MTDVVVYTIMSAAGESSRGFKRSISCTVVPPDGDNGTLVPSSAVPASVTGGKVQRSRVVLPVAANMCVPYAPYDEWRRSGDHVIQSDHLKELYPHPRDADCVLNDVSHEYFIKGSKYPISVSGVWKVFFQEFDSVAMSSRVLQNAEH